MSEFKDWLDKLDSHGACAAAMDWLESLPSTYTPQTAWNNCKRGDWMAWYIDHAITESQLVQLAGCECAEISLLKWEHPNSKRLRNLLVRIKEVALGLRDLGEILDGIKEASKMIDPYSVATALAGRMVVLNAKWLYDVVLATKDDTACARVIWFAFPTIPMIGWGDLPF